MGRELAIFVALNQAIASAALLGAALANQAWAYAERLARQETIQARRRAVNTARRATAAGPARRDNSGQCAAWRLAA